MLVFGVIPCFKRGQLTFTGLSEVYADDFGGEYDTPDITLDGVDLNDPHILKEVVITAYQDYQDPNWLANMFYLMNYLQNITLPQVISSDGFDWDAFLAQLEDMFSNAEQSTNDPCADAKRSSDLAKNTSISSTIDKIRRASTSKEYGTEIKTATPASSAPYLPPSDPRTNNQAQSFTPNFTWNSNDGYTIGLPHGHPDDVPPSLGDIFKLGADYRSNAVRTSGTDAISYYQQNAWVSAITPNSTYMVNVSDWTSYMAICAVYSSDPAAFTQNFADKVIQYYQDTGNPDQGAAQTYALLKLFGNSINLSKAAAGSTDFKPLGISEYGTVEEKTCP